jgi:hypothetical protein
MSFAMFMVFGFFTALMFMSFFVMPGIATGCYE